MGRQTGLSRSRYEQKLAAASKMLYYAAETAESLGDPGAAEDCIQLRTELQRLMEDSLRGRKRPRRQLAAEVD